MPRTALACPAPDDRDKSLYSVLKSNPRLLSDGDPHPDCFWRNKSDFGYVSPFREFVESPVKPTPMGLSMKWSVSYATIEGWRLRGQWDAIREREWNSIHERAWQLSKDAIAEVQSKELTDQLSMWRRMRDSIDSTLRHGKVIEQSATGKVIERTLSVKDRKDAAQTIALCDDNINRILGMGKGLLAAGEAIDDPKTARPVRRVRFTFSEVREDFDDPKAPELSEPSPFNRELPILDGISALEGEVVSED